MKKLFLALTACIVLFVAVLYRVEIYLTYIVEKRNHVVYVFEGFSHRQIAEMLGIKEGTSASQLYYAKQLLAKKISELTKDK